MVTSDGDYSKARCCTDTAFHEVFYYHFSSLSSTTLFQTHKGKSQSWLVSIISIHAYFPEEAISWPGQLPQYPAILNGYLSSAAHSNTTKPAKQPSRCPSQIVWTIYLACLFPICWETPTLDGCDKFSVFCCYCPLCKMLSQSSMSYRNGFYQTCLGF